MSQAKPQDDQHEQERAVPHPDVRSFTLRYAANWRTGEQLRSTSADHFLYRRHAPLTGQIVATSGGEDVTFSDITA